MLAFLTFFCCLSNILLFLTQIRKNHVISEIFTKNKIICDTESINTWVRADKACRVTDFSNITSS